MKQWVIDKLGLIATGKTLGASFLHDIKIYHFFPGVYCGACDTQGLPSNKILFYTVYGSCAVSLTFIKHNDPKFILIEVLRKLLKKPKEDETEN